jgi:NADH-quinone oxidoreductase subunit M
VPWYLGGSAVCFVVGVAFLAAADSLEPRLELAGVCFVLLAALIRKGIFPFHAWVPHVFEHGPLGPAILFAAPQLGAYAVVVLILPRVGVDVAWGVAIAALVTAVYAAALAVVQRDARRTCGYLFISQSALVMAGLDCTSERALSGALIVWIASALAFAGISRCVLVLELRRGRQDLSRYHGGYESMPALAVAFLVLGLACTGFPGTLGFIGQEMLVDGATDEFPVLGFCVIAAGSLTGVAVLRMYFSLFCGRKTSPSKLAPTRPVEVVVFGTLAAVLIATGLFPGAVADSRIEAAREIALRPHVAGLFAEEVNEHANDDTAHSRLSARER